MTTQVQPQDKTVTANGMSLHYLDWGSVGKSTMVLLHGLRGHSHSWDDVSQAMCRDFRVLALDQRGRGDSEWARDGDYTTDAYVADADGFIQELGLDSFILVGHSMGGRNSLAFAGRYPEKLEKLVIVDIGPDRDPRGIERIRREITELPEEFDSFEAVVEYMKRDGQRVAESVLRRRLQYMTRELPDGKVGWRYDLAIREERRRGTGAPDGELWPVLANIACPTLIVRGAESDLLTAKVAQRMVETLPDAKSVEIPRAGHMVFEDNPDDFLEALKEFLA